LLYDYSDPGGGFENVSDLGVKAICIIYISFPLSHHKIKKFYFSKKICYTIYGDTMKKEENNLFPTEEPNYDLLDRSSSEYRKAKVENEYIRETLSKEDETPLSKALKEATHLADDLKKRYIYLAGIYLEDMKHNIFKNQFELHEAYDDISADEWNDFLNDRIVSTYLSRHKRTLLKSAAEDNLANPLAKNKRDNLKLIENIEEQEKLEAHKNIVIMRIPDIYDEE